MAQGEVFYHLQGGYGVWVPVFWCVREYSHEALTHGDTTEHEAARLKSDLFFYCACMYVCRSQRTWKVADPDTYLSRPSCLFTHWGASQCSWWISDRIFSFVRVWVCGQLTHCSAYMTNYDSDQELKDVISNYARPNKPASPAEFWHRGKALQGVTVNVLSLMCW